MGNYATKDARFTAIYRRETRAGKGGEKQEVFFRVPFELVRFNVDDAGESEQLIVPVGQSNKTPATKDDEKIYEKIWVVDVVPFHVGRNGKHDFAYKPESVPTSHGD